MEEGWATSLTGKFRIRILNPEGMPESGASVPLELATSTKARFPSEACAQGSEGGDILQTTSEPISCDLGLWWEGPELASAKSGFVTPHGPPCPPGDAMGPKGMAWVLAEPSGGMNGAAQSQGRRK
jgi:hypothetical protein